MRPMKTLRLLVFTALLASPLAAHAADNELTAAEKSAGWQLVFDGKTFANLPRLRAKETADHRREIAGRHAQDRAERKRPGTDHG